MVPYKKDGRLLDVGCGSGQHLYLMKQLGWETCGVEISGKACEYARNTLNLDVRKGTLEAAAFSDDYFDVVTIWHVLEHLPDPISTCKEVCRILKPLGKLIVGIPNSGSLTAKIFKDKWIGWDVPRHLYGFSAETLRLMLEKTGFKVDKIIYPPESYWAMSIQFWLQGIGLKAFLADNFLLHYTFYPLAVLASRLKRGDSIEARATKCVF